MKGQFWALIPAAGSGRRMGLGFNKQYAPYKGMPILGHTLLAFSQNPLIKGIIVVVAPGEEAEFQEKIPLPQVPVLVVTGGATRQESVYRGLVALEKEIFSQEQGESFVLIHDGARPNLSQTLLTSLIEATAQYKAVAPGLTPADTVKEISGEGQVIKTPPREDLRLIQTPQVFSLPLILRAHLAAREAGFLGTDDCQLVERLGERVQVIPGDPENIKVTVPQDLVLLEGGRGKVRIGHGFDVHRLEKGRPFIVGGVEIPHPVGPEGHSDADFLLHAISDALLGAAGLGDLGAHFPDTSPKFKDISSLKLLAEVGRLVANEGYQIANIDSTVVMEEPKLAPYRSQIKEQIGTCLGLDPSLISVKATTQEGLGFVGSGLGVMAWAVVLLEGRE